MSWAPHSRSMSFFSCLCVFGIEFAYDEQRRSILHRLTRIHEFGLAENIATGFFGGTFQFDEGRVADRLDDVIIDVHEREILPVLLPNQAMTLERARQK